MIGGGIFVAALITMPLAADAAQLLSINVIGAIGSGLSGAGASAIIASRGREMGMGSVMGLINAGDNLGMATGPIIAGVIFDSIGLVELFYGGGIMAAIGFLLFYLLIRRQNVM
jgi:MFS family permease